MGGMAAWIPVKSDPAKNEAAFAKVRADKEREANDGHDGTWVAHPGMVELATNAFNAVMKDPNQIALAWIVDFPFYELDEKTGKLDFGHNPFSMPKGGLEALESENKLGIIADQYDMVMNGYEICSGGVRNHNPEVLYKVFGVLGYSREYVDARFGGMINAFKYGAPPHAGCAFGIDRMFMVLMNEDNIREIVAFPKNGSGVDLMMNSPSVVDDTQLKELRVKIVEE